MAEERRGFFKKLLSGLSKTRDNIVSGIESVFMGVTTIDDDFYDELEEALILGDLGAGTAEEVIERLREEVEKQHLMHPRDCKDTLIEILREMVDVPEDAYDFENQKSAVLVVGVNGVGKTTTIGKLAAKYRRDGKRVIMAAADTFRAAAIEQLTEWANRSGVYIIAQNEGSDPSAVIYDAVSAAKSRGTDILICDTAGRLHNKKNLMEELKKMNRIIDREWPEACRETLLVLDATTGQNAINQAREFMSAADVTGIVLTKMDGTAKGGMAISVRRELGIPVKYIGVGEKIDDLERFDSEEFISALFDGMEV
ncbi:MAG: signal recognition particle-docking protein FtsY [Lachnospiraceae bacterium]|nr:signal recognition particle-docking protein FtsY [Lachnospiraceae bacterium]